MKIIYSSHIKVRMALRMIDRELPKDIYKTAAERFIDAETGHLIAVKKAKLYDKERDIMVAYTKGVSEVTLLTIHPLKEGQKEKRIQSGRWRKI